MAKKKQEQQRITLTQFKTWIKGFEELSDSEKDWCPTPAQWKKIRDKLELIDETSSPQGQSKMVVTTSPPHVDNNMTPPPSSTLSPPPSSLRSSAPRMVSSVPMRSPLQAPAGGGGLIKEGGSGGQVLDADYSTPFV